MRLLSPRMKNFQRAFPIFAAFFLCSQAWAASIAERVQLVTDVKPETVSRDLIEFESSYVFESDLHRGGSFGDQYEVHNSFSYGHRFLLNGHLYLHLGISYDRFDFGNTGAPVPEHLQGVAGTIGIDYMHNNDVGAFIQVKPGFYTEDDFDSSSFDAPITSGTDFCFAAGQALRVRRSERVFSPRAIPGHTAGRADLDAEREMESDGHPT